VRSTISLDFEPMIDLRLKRPDQRRCLQRLRSMGGVVALLGTSLSCGMTDAYVRIRGPVVRAVHLHVPLRKAIDPLLQGRFVVPTTFPVE
jgi:hypothetical protein